MRLVSEPRLPSTNVQLTTKFTTGSPSTKSVPARAELYCVRVDVHARFSADALRTAQRRAAKKAHRRAGAGCRGPIWPKAAPAIMDRYAWQPPEMARRPGGTARVERRDVCLSHTKSPCALRPRAPTTRDASGSHNLFEGGSEAARGGLAHREAGRAVARRATSRVAAAPPLTGPRLFLEAGRPTAREVLPPRGCRRCRQQPAAAVVPSAAWLLASSTSSNNIIN